MSIPANLTHAEVGALLVAVGKHMINNDVCADAVLEMIDGDYSMRLVTEIQEAHWGSGTITMDRGLQLLNITLEEAINFVEPQYGFVHPDNT